METIISYFSELSDTQKIQFTKLKGLYTFWNAQINVISRKDIDELYNRHVLHSLGIAKVLTFEKNTTILDVGTGGGFPGIPLAIMFPETSFYLVDSIGKKIKVVKEVASSLGLKNIKAEQIRMEQVDHAFDFIISRAVTALPDFVKWTGYKFQRKSFNTIPNGILYLKGGDVKQEIKNIKRIKNKIYSIRDYFQEPFFDTKSVIHLY